MPAVISNQGKLPLLNSERSYLGSLTLRLFQSDIDPDEGTTLDVDFTECDFPGYAPVALGGWSLPVLNGDGDAVTYSDIQEFGATSSGGANDIFGWYATDGAGHWILGERDPQAPYHMEDALTPHYSVRVSKVLSNAV